MKCCLNNKRNLVIMFLIDFIFVLCVRIIGNRTIKSLTYSQMITLIFNAILWVKMLCVCACQCWYRKEKSVAE